MALIRSDHMCIFFVSVFIILQSQQHQRDNLVFASDFHALLHPVDNSPLPGSSTLSEGNRSTEGTSGSAISDSHDTDIGGVGYRSITGHTSRHLDLHFKLGARGKRDTLDTKTGNVLSDCCGLHGSLIGSTRRTVNIGSERARTVLVNLEVVRREDRKDGVHLT